MKNYLLNVSFLTFVITTIISCATVAKTNQELQALAADPNSKIIHNLDDFDKFSKKKFLKKLDPSILQTFRDSLKFKNGGLAGAHVVQIKNALSRRNFARLIGRFGIGDVLLTDYADRRCDPIHTCKHSPPDICTWLCAF